MVSKVRAEYCWHESIHLTALPHTTMTPLTSDPTMCQSLRCHTCATAFNPQMCEADMTTLVYIWKKVMLPEGR